MGSRDHSVLFLATAFGHTIISKFTKSIKIIKEHMVNSKL